MVNDFGRPTGRSTISQNSLQNKHHHLGTLAKPWCTHPKTIAFVKAPQRAPLSPAHAGTSTWPKESNDQPQFVKHIFEGALGPVSRVHPECFLGGGCDLIKASSAKV